MSFLLTIKEFVLTDRFGFCFFEILFFAIFLYTLWKDLYILWKEKKQSKQGIEVHVIRGEESRKVFLASASAFTTFVLSIIFTITSYPKEGRVVFYLINLGMVIYLFFYSCWFTNKLLELWTKCKQKPF